MNANSGTLPGQEKGDYPKGRTYGLEVEPIIAVWAMHNYILNLSLLYGDSVPGLHLVKSFRPGDRDLR
jgi:hypothetical protein